MFAFSSHNERITQIYGCNNWWTWLRYWWLDTANQVTMMLIDKPYYDYDYDPTKVNKQGDKPTVKRDAKQMESLLRKFNFNTKIVSPKAEHSTLEQFAEQMQSELNNNA